MDSFLRGTHHYKWFSGRYSEKGKVMKELNKIMTVTIIELYVDHRSEGVST